MNRQVIRTLAKGKLTPQELTNLLHEEGLIATGMAVDGLSTAFAMVLHDSKTPKVNDVALIRILKDVDDLFKAIVEDRITVEDLQETLFEETGIVVQSANGTPTRNKAKKM